MGFIPYIIISIIAVFFGQIAAHLNKKLPPVVSEEITYKEFFKTLKNDFKIDIFYSLIFLILFNLLIYFVGNTYISYVYAIVIFALSITFSVDLRYKLIPDEVHIIIAFAGIINLIFNFSNFFDYVLGAIVGGGIFYLLGVLSLVLLKKEGMGFGDVKLMAALGFVFGFKNILVITLVSFVFGAIVGSIVLIFKRKETDGYIPFGPFIAIAACILMFVDADYIINIYLVFCGNLGRLMADGLYFVLEKLHLVK